MALTTSKLDWMSFLADFTLIICGGFGLDIRSNNDETLTHSRTLQSLPIHTTKNAGFNVRTRFYRLVETPSLAFSRNEVLGNRIPCDNTPI